MADQLPPPPPPPNGGTPPEGDRWRTEFAFSVPPPDGNVTLDVSVPRDPPSLVGQTIGDFELTSILGRGGMGIVYKARQLSLEREVAVKLLLPEHTSNAHLLTRFLAEARAAAKLAHPNIVSIYQIGECSAGPYFVMEFIDGDSLDELAGKQLPIGWTVALMATVADAVHHAHQKGIIHRDLKPANIMIHQNKRPVVMDFGIAKTIGQGSGLTLQGVVVGTPSFMPPEQAASEQGKVGPHSDVYSLGAILYVLLTGRTPYGEESALKTLLKVVSAEPPAPVRSLRPDVPAALEAVCHKCLSKKPADRYPTAAALADELRRVRVGLTRPAGTTQVASQPSIALVGPGGKAIRLFAPTTVIGRGSECDVPVKLPEVSKRHCRIVLEGEQAFVEDLGSSNGTFVNGAQVIERTALNDGDELDVGGRVFTVKVERAKPK